MITGAPAVTDVVTGVVGVFGCFWPPRVSSSDKAAAPPAATRMAVSVPYVLPGELTLTPVPPGSGKARFTAALFLGTADRIEWPTIVLSSAKTVERLAVVVRSTTGMHHLNFKYFIPFLRPCVS